MPKASGCRRQTDQPAVHPRGTRQQAQEKQILRRKVNRSLPSTCKIAVSFPEEMSHSDRAGSYHNMLRFAALSFLYFCTWLKMYQGERQWSTSLKAERKCLDCRAGLTARCIHRGRRRAVCAQLAVMPLPKQLELSVINEY